MRVIRVLLLVFASFAWLNGPITSAQSAQAPRIVEKIDEGVRVPLRGNTLPVANVQTDSGPVASNLAMTDLVLVLRRSPEKQAAFDDFVASQYDPSSPNYHHWLEPAEVGEQFGPSLADIASITQWLTSHGLVITAVSKDRTAIRFAGTAAQVENAFHTEMHNLFVHGQTHIANMSDPEIPVALAPVVGGVKGLNDFHPRPMHRMGGQAQFNSSTGMWQRVSDASRPNTPASQMASPKPEFGIPGSIEVEDVSPYDFATIYNVLPLWNASIDGTGETIAIVATSDVNPADVASYRSIFGLPAGPALNTIIANGTDPGQCTAQSGTAACTIDDLYENTLDVEVSGGVAKGAQIDLVVSGPTSPSTDPIYSSASYVIENKTANILSVSYGLCELFMGTSGNAAYNNLWETAAVEGIGVFVATGDSGSPGCDQGLDSTIPYGAQYGLSVSGLASTAYNTAVGGTDFAWCKPTIDGTGHTVGCSTVTPYWNTSNNTTTGASAASYVPEIPWNDSCASSAAAAYLESLASFLKFSGVANPEAACNFVVNNYQSINQQYGVNLSFFVDSIGGGGGASNCTVNSTTDTTTNPDPASCSGGYAKPSWQAGVAGIPSDGKRDIPDVSLFSGNGLWASATLICVSEAGSCLTSTNPTTEPIAQEIGGTSVAAPEMAGVMALVNQKAGAAQGNPNAGLYALAARQTYSGCSAQTVKTSSSCYFNDINTSTNATPCKAGALNCTVAHSGDAWGILSGFSAGTGFDEATGLGSLNVANVVNNWNPAGGAQTATVTVTPSQNTVAINQSLTVTVSVTGSSGTPNGNVGLVSSGYVGTAGTLSSGSFTFTIPAYSLAGGSDTLTVSYGGDSTYGKATGTANITVTKLTPTVSVTATPSTVGANANVTVAITVTGAGPGPTGSIQLSGGGASGTCTLAGGTCSVTIASNSLNSGTITLTAAYSGDKDYSTGSGTATLVVKTLTPTVTVTPSLKSLNTATPLPVTVTITGTGPVPTGTVLLYGEGGGNPSNGYGLLGTLSGGSCTFTIQPATLLPGTETLYAVYQGDSVYLPTTVTTTVTVTKATPSITVTPSATNIYTNSFLTVSGTVTGLVGTSISPFESVSVTGGGYTGTGALNFGAVGTEPQYSITIPPGSLSAGTDTLTVTYLGDTFFNPASATTTVNVTQFVKIPSSVTVTPASGTLDSGQMLGVTVAVNGSDGVATGTISLSAGNSTQSGALTYSGTGSFLFSFPANTFGAGTLTLTANYSGDATYLASSGSSTVTVTQSVFAVSAAAATPAAVAKGAAASSIISVSSSTNYSGVITLSCALASGPTNPAGDAPTCFIPNAPVQAGGTTTATVSTFPATSAALIRPRFSPKNGMLAGGTALAFLFLCGIPARRRSWRALFGLAVILLGLGGVSACGGGGGGGGVTGGGGGTGNPGTAAGAYSFTVTATGSPAVTPAPTATFTVTVN